MRRTTGHHYTIVQIGFDARQPGVPVIVTDEDGGRILFEAFYFITRVPHRDKSRTWQGEAVRAIARFYDFYRVVVPDCVIASEQMAGTLIAKFIESQKYGSSWVPELDNSSLYWKALSPADLGKTKQYLSKFLETIAEVKDNALSNAGFKSFALSTYRAVSARRREGDNRSLLYHISETAQKDRKGRYPFPDRAAYKSATVRARHFPFDAVGELIVEGCRRKRRRSEYTGLASEYNLNLLMAVLLCAGAGLRSSEIFHMFVRDVTRKHVRLLHPEHGRVKHQGSFVSRQQFLREVYYRLPRTRLSGAQFAGFKSMAMTEKDSDQEGPYSVAHFLPESIHGIPFREWFYSAHREYILNILPEGADHPYLFVNSSNSDGFGDPWTKTAMRDAFNVAVRKIGLNPDRSKGVHPHGLRHFYGQSLKSLNVSPLVIQTCMHHKTLEAQLAYTSATEVEVNRELTALEATLKRGETYMPQGEPIDLLVFKYKSDPAGLFTTAKIGASSDRLR
ncbi:tyrosine-type recombinase/integrase [Leisingera aquaemixtae]|uniref:Site-specific recombinase XerD n=1 Tax=Leisingera aquaemixtae TaxID=1396826 RepID=A0A0P1HET1_9RHOB|nr:tyrosine-type recombinase/integrase [Leisingera aquaemixtae]CUI02164.1 Site-specific recombinase XerD [Leisingera aquaemixtae]